MTELAALLAWLKQATGDAGRRHFENGKIDVRGPWSGRYIDALLYNPAGHVLAVELLNTLRAGLTIPVVDVEAYYAAGKRWPVGMRLLGRRLVSVWDDEPAPGAAVH